MDLLFTVCASSALVVSAVSRVGVAVQSEQHPKACTSGSTYLRTYEAIRGEAAICSPFSRLNELVALEALIHEELECDLAVLMDLQRAQKLHNHP